MNTNPCVRAHRHGGIDASLYDGASRWLSLPDGGRSNRSFDLAAHFDAARGQSTYAQVAQAIAGNQDISFVPGTSTDPPTPCSRRQTPRRFRTYGPGVQQPNFFGSWRRSMHSPIGAPEQAHADAWSTRPRMAGSSRRHCGDPRWMRRRRDIVCGEGQALAWPLGIGRSVLRLMATRMQ